MSKEEFKLNDLKKENYMYKVTIEYDDLIKFKDFSDYAFNNPNLFEQSITQVNDKWILFGCILFKTIVAKIMYTAIYQDKTMTCITYNGFNGKDYNYILDYIISNLENVLDDLDVFKLLPNKQLGLVNAFESILYAVYLDSNNNMVIIEKIVSEVVNPIFMIQSAFVEDPNYEVYNRGALKPTSSGNWYLKDYYEI